jgi:hypothetical protein
MSRFLYLNIYSILIFCAGILVLVLPFYSITKWTLVVQGIIAIKLFFISGKLFSTWDAKKREIDLLVNRNKNEFRPDTFEVFMQAPCGRLVVREALQDLNMLEKYKTLLKLQKPLLERLRNNCTPSKTVIFINEEIL